MQLRGIFKKDEVEDRLLGCPHKDFNQVKQKTSLGSSLRVVWFFFINRRKD
jgi:hypothetical protein